MKINAIEFSLARDKYLGRSYEEMDCQAVRRHTEVVTNARLFSALTTAV